MSSRRTAGRRIFRLPLIGCALAVGVLIGLPPAPDAHPAQKASTPATPSVAVNGNRLVNARGEQVRLLGVNRSGAEYACLGGRHIFDGPTDSASVQAMVTWRVQAVRVPLNEDCWLGINGVGRAVGGAAYQHAIEGYVGTLESHGIVVILDLHWAAPGRYVARGQWPVPDLDHAPRFWTSVARAFVANRGVIFDLFNEPYTSSWSCWLHGCLTRYTPSRRPVSYKSAGMQTLVNAVRATGAGQPIMLGGLKYSSDDSEWLAFEPADPDHQLIVGFHTYNFGSCSTEACWNSTIAPLAAKLPVITGEIGENGCKQKYIDSYMAWADTHRVSYLAWAWDSTGPPSGWKCSGGPALIKNYGGTPTAFGAGLKSHLARLDLPPLTSSLTP
jgi:Cellulase (glycosyl hydrolase family 5)